MNTDIGLLSQVMNAFPAPIFVVDEDMKVRMFNSAASSIIEDEPAGVLHRKGGDVLRCINSGLTPGGCGCSPACADCLVRNSVKQAFASSNVEKARTRMQLVKRSGETSEVWMRITVSPFDHAGERLAILVLEDITELILLKSFIPMCAGCRKIRNDDDSWSAVEEYLSKHLDVEVSHGMCPDCIEKYYPGYGRRSLPTT